MNEPLSEPAACERGRQWGGCCAATALVVSAVGTAGTLGLSLVLGLRACPLCFYQRTAVMGVLALLLLGLATDRARAAWLCLLALPLSAAGLGIAGFHQYLVYNGTLECPAGFFGWGSAPAQSLAMFVVLTLALACGAAAGCLASGCRGGSAVALLGALLLGAAMAWGCVASSPPIPKPPDKPYDPINEPLIICRPPYRGP
jgi:disulfide bond formation protein DsbB